MIINIGTPDRIFRLTLALVLVWLGLFFLDGLNGDLLGIAVALTSLLPFYMVATRSCFVFRWFGISSIRKKS